MLQPRPLLALLLLSTSDALRVPAHRCSITTMFAGDGDAVARVRGVLFDVDGTLCDSDALHLAVFRELLVEEGFDGGAPITEETFMARISGRQNALILADLFPEWEADRCEAFAERKEAAFRAKASAPGGLTPVPGAAALLSSLKGAGVRVAAVTNAPRANAELMLTGAFGPKALVSVFEELIIGDECQRAKPDPCPYLTAMERLGLKPDECVVFEDSLAGATAGVASGARATVGVRTANTDEALRGVGCAFTVRDFTEAPLRELLGVAMDESAPSR